MADRRRNLAWGVLILGVLAAGGVAFWLLHGEPERDDRGQPIARPTAPDVRPPDLPEPTERVRPEPPPPEKPRTGQGTGRIVDEHRVPIAGARVSALRGMTVTGMPGLLAPKALHLQAQTDAQGAFSLPDLPVADDILLRVEGEFSPAEMGPFTIAAGGTSDFGDLVIPAGMVIAGEVRDPSSQPVAGARVGLYQGLVEEGPDGEPGEPHRVVLTDERGRFELKGALADSFNLVVAAKGFARARIADGPPLGEKPARMDLLVNLVLARPVTGSTFTESGEPLSGVRVLAMPLQPGNDGGSAVSDSQGKFSIEELAPGAYGLVASRKGYSTANSRTSEKDPTAAVDIVLRKQGTLSGFVVGDDDKPIVAFDIVGKWSRRRMDPPVPIAPSRRITDKNGAFTIEGLDPGFAAVDIWARGYALTSSESVRVQQGEAVSGVVIKLLRGATLFGVVVNDAGLPMAGAHVSLHLNREPEVDFLRDDPKGDPRLKDTRTDAEGRFAIEELPPLTYQIQVDHPDCAVLRRNDVVVLAAQDNDAGTIMITRSGTVRGTALTTGGAAAPGAQVTLMLVNGPSRQVQADRKGRFVFSRIPPGDYTLQCFATTANLQDMLNTLGAKEPPFPVAPGQELDLNVTSTN